MHSTTFQVVVCTVWNRIRDKQYSDYGNYGRNPNMVFTINIIKILVRAVYFGNSKFHENYHKKLKLQIEIRTRYQTLLPYIKEPNIEIFQFM